MRKSRVRNSEGTAEHMANFSRNFLRQSPMSGNSPYYLTAQMEYLEDVAVQIREIEVLGQDVVQVGIGFP